MAAKYVDIDEQHSTQRFSDIVGEPCRMLMPIEGYEKKPLVSLEEAVEPIVEYVPDVRRKVYVAKVKCAELSPGKLSIDEAASITLYTMEWEPQDECLYHVLNKTLRNENRKTLKPWFLFLRLLLTALAQLPSISATVYRGVKQDMSKEYAVGKTFVWWGFSSCTTKIQVLDNKQFMGATGQRTFFTIECDSGKNIQKYSCYKAEHEILLPAARQFRVEGCLKQGKHFYMIQLKEIQPPFPLIELVPLTSTVKVPPPANPIPQNITSVNTQTKTKVIPSIHANAEWAQDGVIVAGGYGQGNGTNQLYWPFGLFVNDDQTVVIADYGNHRIMQWKKDNAMNGQVAAGGKGQGSRLDQLNMPTDVLIDKETDSLIICDWGNRRVVQWSRRSGTTQGAILMDSIDCWGLAMDDQRYLYVSDVEKHEVMRYQLGDKNGTLVAGGNGRGNGRNQLKSPTYLFVDRQQNVYVSDNGNHRVMKWNKGAKEGIVVAGGQSKGNALTQLAHPQGLFVDTLGTLYVADQFNHRVMRWTQGAKNGTVIMGGYDSDATALNNPRGLSFDRYGNLYIADVCNHRIQQFSLQ
ncbi:unnamed protein product [Rotaria socialis]|uniref:NAD(P)(+)--arginine ADP-ribosyltransferase n=2 Tax=Rotaria socialis TaxID=392032 RepID=A0A820YDS5_9BILA|nr:unnamed protein product [Rotaria socialis]CAF4544979.1 unnamed protein product [Rotaria socialis]